MGFEVSRLRALAATALLLGGVLVVVGSIEGPAANAATVAIPAIVRDFDHDPKVNAPNAHPDFEAFISDDPGIVTDTLGSDGKPVYGDHPSGTDTTTGAAAFNQWYHDDATVNRAVPVTLNFDQTGDQLTFDGDNFFPIDAKGWNDPAVGDGVGQVDNEHNYSFTMELHMTFQFAAGQTFTFTGDDDVFVYFNKFLGIDLGGVHGAESETVNLDDIAADAGMTAGNTYPLDIFFAERHTSDSNFNVDANFAAAAATTSTSTTTSSTTTTTIVGQTTTTSSTSTSTSTTTSTTVPASTTTSSTLPPTSTSTTVRPTTTSTTIAVAGLRRTGSNVGPMTGAGFLLLGSGAVLALVDRSRYKGRHFV